MSTKNTKHKELKCADCNAEIFHRSGRCWAGTGPRSKGPIKRIWRCIKCDAEIQRLKDEMADNQEDCLKEDLFHYSDLLSPMPEPGPDDVVERRLLKLAIDQCLGSLTDRERKIIELRYGIGDECSRTLDDLAIMFRVSKDRIRQIESKALRRLRHPLQRRRLDSFVGFDEEKDVLSPPSKSLVKAESLTSTLTALKRKEDQKLRYPLPVGHTIDGWKVVGHVGKNQNKVLLRHSSGGRVYLFRRTLNGLRSGNCLLSYRRK